MIRMAWVLDLFRREPRFGSDSGELDRWAGKVVPLRVDRAAFHDRSAEFADAFVAPIVTDQLPRWLLVSLYSLGDSYLVAALASAFRDRHVGSREELCIVIKESHLGLIELFESAFDGIYTVPNAIASQTVAHLMQHRIRGRFGANAAQFAHPHHMNDTRVDEFTQIDGVSQAQMYANLLRVPIDSALDRPVIPARREAEAEELCRKLGMTEGRAVILFPDANSWPPVEDEFWRRLSVRLHHAGWQVFTNVTGTHRGPRARAFPASRIADIPLELALPVLARAGWAIGSLCGFMNFVISAQTRCKKTMAVRGPRRGEVIAFNDRIQLGSAFPYAYQRKFDGFDYDIEELQVRGPDSFDEVVEKIVNGLNASVSFVPSAAPVHRVRVDLSPGELIDKITVLEVKLERLDGDKARQITRELDVLRESWQALVGTMEDTLEPYIRSLRDLNRDGWDVNELIYRDFDDPDYGTERWAGVGTDAASLEHAASSIRSFRKSQLLNRYRTKAKNEISRLLSAGWREEKSFDA